MIATRQFRPVFELADKLFRLPTWDGVPAGTWLEAVALQESAGNPRATRYEPGIDVRSSHDADTPGKDDGNREDDKSYGLMQVLGSTYKQYAGAQELGQPFSYEALFSPFVNVGIAVLYLQDLLARTQNNVPRALAIYNGGWHGGDWIGKELKNQQYVDKIRLRVEQVIADRAGSFGGEVH